MDNWIYDKIERTHRLHAGVFSLVIFDRDDPERRWAVTMANLTLARGSSADIDTAKREAVEKARELAEGVLRSLGALPSERLEIRYNSIGCVRDIAATGLNLRTESTDLNEVDLVFSNAAGKRVAINFSAQAHQRVTGRVSEREFPIEEVGKP